MTKQENELLAKLRTMQEKLEAVLYNRTELIENILCGLLAGGHTLLESLPGLGKTQLIKAVGMLSGLDVKRIQFTPDLLPADITGTTILTGTLEERNFEFQKGPVFCNVLLADEINRASPKTQSALLEAMQERRITVAATTHRLPEPFFVLATQNPIELEGTYPLPEAQLDRFLLKLYIEDTDVDTLEKIVLSRSIIEPETPLEPILCSKELIELRTMAHNVYLAPVIATFIARIVHATNDKHHPVAEYISYGASPRAAIGIAAAAKSYALLNGRETTDISDVKRVAPHVLNHRISINYHAKVQQVKVADIISKILDTINPYNSELPPAVEALTRRDYDEG